MNSRQIYFFKMEIHKKFTLSCLWLSTTFINGSVFVIRLYLERLIGIKIKEFKI